MNNLNPRPRHAYLDWPAPIAFAHRGGAREGPENTWASFTHAHELGYRYMETDVHATSDGTVVTIHDPTLDRVGGGPGTVRCMSWNRLSAVRLGSGEAVPRLDDLLAAWPEVRWNIDAKHDSVVEPLIATLRRCGDAALDRVCLTSFNDRRLLRIRRQLGPGLCTAMGPAAVASLRTASLLPPAASRRMAGPLGRFAAAQVPLRQGRVPVVDARFINAAHGAGIAVHVWTVDDPPAMERLLDLGVDGLMTDSPGTLKGVLEQRGQWVTS